MPADLELVRAFEAKLDAALAAATVAVSDANASLGLAANIYESAFSRSEWFPIAELFDRGMTIVARSLVSGSHGPEPDVAALVSDMQFASHYYMVREYLYYTYNAPDSMTWAVSDDRVEIRFADRSIPRQFFTAFNDWLLDSRDLFEGFGKSDEVRGLIKGEPEYALTDNVRQAYELIEQEADLKLGAYFSIIDVTSDIDLGGYSYKQFIDFYRPLLAKSLYHRYFAQVNGAVGAVFIPPAELLDAAIEHVPRAIGERVLRDIVFDDASARDKLDAAYFSLFSEGSGDRRIVMRPHHFARADGIVNVLRVVAQRRPQLFLENVSDELGRSFARRVKQAFADQGFTCHSDVSLRAFGSHLPDIDLLVISEEPTLGFVMLVCELKSPIPPRWAKDQLKVLRKDGVSKAFKQVKAIRSFLQTDEGVRFIRSLLPPEGIPHFDGFVTAIQHLVITSNNSGMFFGAEATRVVNFRTLTRLLRRSDGDMAFIQHVLATYDTYADEATNCAMAEFQVGRRSIAYEGVSKSPVLDFPAVEWRSSPERQRLIDEFIASGAHPFDVLGGEGESTARANDGQPEQEN